MTMRAMRGWLMALICLRVGVGWACSEEWGPVVFVSSTPDAPAAYAAGKLGLVRGNYELRHLVVAYRYLKGGALSADEQAIEAKSSLGNSDYGSDMNIPSGAGVSPWLEVRGGAGSPAPAIPSTVRNYKRTQQVNGKEIEIGGMYLNCPEDAFTTAVATYNDRLKQWGAGSPQLLNWIAGQDAVFSNCGDNLGTTPAAAPNDAPMLLKQDRAYQIAAAHFYRGEWDEARKGFDAIARDKSSPWQIWGGYLAARTDVRQAYVEASLPTGDQYVSTFDAVPMNDALKRLEAVVQSTSDARVRHAAEMELEFVRIRVDSAAAVDAIARVMSSGKPDADFEQHLIDLHAIQRRNLNMGSSDLAQWILAMQKDPSTAYARWKQQPSLPWLIAALSSATADDAQAQELLAAAAKVSAASPGYTTANYERARLLLRLSKSTEARDLLTKELPLLRQDSKHPSAANAYTGLRMLTAANLDAMLQDAPRMVVDPNIDQAVLNTPAETCYGAPGASYCIPKKDPQGQFADDAAILFNERFPMSLWVEAAKSHALTPEYLRSEFAMAAWTRAAMLHDDASARALLPLLPKPLQAQAGDGTGFGAVFAMLHGPGLAPWIVPGPQPEVNYDKVFGHGSWWCAESEPGAEGQPYATDQIVWPLPDPLFLKPEEKAQAATEAAALKKLPAASILLSQKALAFAREHPDDPRVPEALAMSVRAMHYGCDSYGNDADAVRKATGKAVFELLHQRYPQSEWTKKTPYYY